jgi:hypothetical protein
VDTTDRCPPRLGNLAQTARFPHSHKPIIALGTERTITSRAKNDRAAECRR